jgi:hypothetical protein
MNSYYAHQRQIEAVVTGFESCTTGKDEFTHQSHLTVAVWYLLHYNEEQATAKMRLGLHRFLDHLGVGQEKYHETLTVFWIKTVREFLNHLDQRSPILARTNAVIEGLGTSRMAFEYYSKELLDSADARNHWVEPDLKALAIE